jgi:hypothetical protein
MGRGENEGYYILADIVCQAIPDPSLNLPPDVCKGKTPPAGGPRKEPSMESVDVLHPEIVTKAEDPPQKSAG